MIEIMRDTVTLIILLLIVIFKCQLIWKTFKNFKFFIIIIGKDTISYMQGICTYIPETNHVPKEYNVAAILSLLFMAPISLAPALAVMYFLHQHFPKCVCSAQYGSFL
jgi:hypothetical protein